jgi:putative flippase GtrA
MWSHVAWDMRLTPSLSRSSISLWRNSPAAAQLIRFGTVGLFAASLYLVGTSLLRQYARLSAPLAASVCFVFIVATNYVLHYSWTFQSRQLHRSAVPRFLGTAVGGLFINYETVMLGTRWLALPQTAVLLLGAALVVTWNYVLSRFWVFVGGDQHS